MEELLVIRYYKGETSKEEDVQVEEWIKKSEENSKVAKELQKVSLAADVAEISEMLDIERALESIHQKMEEKRVNKIQIIFKNMQRVAAILFIPVLISLGFLYSSRDNQIVNVMEVKTNPGMTTSFMLPDSTRVILNSSSSLRYPSKFSGNKREVELTGEAFFSVKKDPKRRFTVKASNKLEIVAYGTEFNVEAYSEDKLIQTTLVSGKVGLTIINNKGRNNLMMCPGQKAIYDIKRKNIAIEKANIEVETSWKDGRLIFRDTPFEDILKSLSKRYNVRFIVKNETLKRNSFTGTFVHQRLERILERFRISSNIKFRFVENGNLDEEKQIIEAY